MCVPKPPYLNVPYKWGLLQKGGSSSNPPMEGTPKKEFLRKGFPIIIKLLGNFVRIFNHFNPT